MLRGGRKRSAGWHWEPARRVGFQGANLASGSEFVHLQLDVTDRYGVRSSKRARLFLETSRW